MRTSDLAAVTLAVLLLAGLSAAAPSAAPSAGPEVGASPSTVAPSVPGGTPATFTNPVLTGNFADPGVLRADDGTWYAYATGDLTVNLQVARSADLVHWERLGEALPKLPFWQPSAKGLTWAPEAWQTSAGTVLYYTARDVQAGRQCLAVAVAASPEGPFVDESTEPLLCQLDQGGSIDPFPFQDADGSRWLLWKNDGNCCALPTRMWIAPLSEDGLAVTGEPVDLGLRNDEPWEAALIEAPTLLHDGDRYVLLYSANAYDSDRYAVGYATSETLTGPYADAPENPILASGGGAAGPGGQAVAIDDDGDAWLLYHAWDPARVGDRVGGARALWLDELAIDADRVRVDGPDVGPQPAP
jgi:beta-xylosidase